MTSHDLLVRARDILGEYEICRGSYAQDSNGLTCELRDEKAVAYCSLGALQRASIDLFGTTIRPEFDAAYFKLHQQVQIEHGTDSIIRWNDAAPDKEIRALFDQITGVKPTAKEPVLSN